MSQTLSKNKHFLSLAAMFFVFTVCFGLWAVVIPSNIINVDGENGSWELNSISLSETSVRLRGDVLHIPNELLTPGEFEAREDEAVLGSIEGQYVITSRIRIYLHDDTWYTFTRLFMGYTVGRLFVNGEWLLDVGIPGENWETTAPDTARIIFTAQPVNGVIEIVQQSTTYLHRWYTVPRYWYVGSQGLISKIRSDDFVSNIIMGCFFAMFLIYLMLFLFRRDYIANLYFALLSLTMFLRTGIIEQGILLDIIPYIDWHIKHRIGYIAIPISAWFLTAVTDKVIPWLFPKYLLIAGYVMLAVSSLVFAFADNNLVSLFMAFLYISFFFSSSYVVFAII